MLADIVKDFLDDAVELMLDVLVEERFEFEADAFGLHQIIALEIAQKFVKRGVEAEVLDHGRAQVVAEIPGA